MKKLLSIKELSKNYLTKKQVICALENINLEVYENDFIALVGPSGCGKSTILSIIGKLQKGSSGKVEFKDKNIKVCLLYTSDAADE